jgi:predicted MFS family arabinose efflux permease
MRHYLIVTASYWGFTLTDGALRMLVLLHFYQLGFTPFTLALLFLLYEAAGIFANLAGGWLATRFGIRRMLTLGLGLQIVGLLFLSALNTEWNIAASVAWVVLAQGLAGVAKDITKTASKSAIKITAVDGNAQLFKWVAWFTGSKNATKGIGFFLGAVLLDAIGFAPALWAMAALLAVILVACVVSLPSGLGAASSSRTAREFLAKSKGVNILAAARVFMFGARDVWFVVGLPVFLYAAGWDFWQVGGFLAAWTIGYGGIQAVAPSFVSRSPDGLSREVPSARLWIAVLTAVPALLVCAVVFEDALPVSTDLAVVVGLMIFGLPFAVNSSLHSYLILAYAGSNKAAEDVGFYYAANAAGRLLGTLLSGVLYQIGRARGLPYGVAFTMLIVCALITVALPRRVET